MGIWTTVAMFAGCILAARFIVGSLRGKTRELAFGLLNTAGVYLFFFAGKDPRAKPVFAIYLAIVCVQYASMALFSSRKGWLPWLAFFTPIFFLVIIRYTPPSYYVHLSGSFRNILRRNPHFTIAPFFVGLSYLAFRASYLVLEVRNGAVKKPGFWNYISFSFFVPTMAVGPINTYANFHKAFGDDRPLLSVGRSLSRIIVGLVKYQFLGPVCNQLTYSGLLLDGHYHHWTDLGIAMVFYYLFLYCNFSGFCDIAIGAAGLIGISVPENFQEPFAARNVKDFWNRWHITLSHYMRDVVFSPLSKFLARIMGPANVNHAIALTIAIVFLLIGIWHGVGWNYAAFGAMHAVGVVANHYYTLGLKKWLGREGFKAYNASQVVHAVAVVLTFCYVAASLFLFANSLAEMKEILSILR